MIKADHISKSFDGRVVLDDVSVEFDTGTTNLVIGKSGSGKTVLLKCLVGLHEVDSGSIWYDDIDFTALGFKERKAIRRDIGMLFQGGALLDSSTVEENVKLPLDLFTEQSEKEKMERVNFCLQRVRLNGANHLYPAELSGGMIKRAAIARAIVLNPKYLFCDEPNSGLDPQTSIPGIRHHHDHQHPRYEFGHGDRREDRLYPRRTQVVGRNQRGNSARPQQRAERFRLRFGHGQTSQTDDSRRRITN